MNKIDYSKFIGQQFGDLTVLKVASINGVPNFFCRCSCGTKKYFDARNVLRGKSKSCGCRRRGYNCLTTNYEEEIISLRASGLSYGKISERLSPRIKISRGSIYVFCLKNIDKITKLKEATYDEPTEDK